MTHQQDPHKKTSVALCHPLSNSGVNRAQYGKKRLVWGPPTPYILATVHFEHR